MIKVPSSYSYLGCEGNESKNIEPGTFSNLRSYEMVPFEQTRKDIAYMKAEKPASTMKKAVFKP